MSSNISETRPLLHRNTNRRNSRSARQLSPSTPTTAFHNNNRRNLRRIRAASAAILLSLVFERIAFYGLAGNLVLFLNKDPFRWESYHAIDASLFFFGLCFATSLVGGWLADSILGRFKALVLSFVIYLAGYVFLPLLTANTPTDGTDSDGVTHKLPYICTLVKVKDTDGDCDTDPFNERCAWLIYIVLTIIAIGTAFVKANIAPFGSDQVAREGQQATLSFFNWFYWSINLGALVGMSVITYVQQQHGFLYGYLASASCLGVSAILFIAGRCCYYVREPDGSVLTNIFRIIREAFRRKRQRSQEILFRRTPSSSQRDGEVDEANPVEAKISFLDYAKHRHGGIFHDALVDDVKQLKKIFAVFAVLIPYWLVYFQMQTTFLVQGLHMRLIDPLKMHLLKNFSEATLVTHEDTNSNSTHNRHPQMVAAWFSLFDVIMLIILLPLFDRVIYPRIERRTGSPVSISRRIVLGMVFAAAAMVTAGIVEHYRLRAFWPFPKDQCRNASFDQYIGDTEYEAADMSILWQIPQYALLGFSEVFTSVAGLQFAVSVAPKSMKGIIMGLFYLFSGIGSFLGTAIIATLSFANTWFLSKDYGNINCRICQDDKVMKSCHLDYYFYLLASIAVVGALLFLLVARAFHLDEHHRHSRTSQQLTDTSSDFMDTPSHRPNGHSRQHTIQRRYSSSDALS